MFNGELWNKTRRTHTVECARVEELAHGIATNWPSVRDKEKDEKLKKLMRSDGFQALAVEVQKLPSEVQPPAEPYKLLAWTILLTSHRSRVVLKRPYRA